MGDLTIPSGMSISVVPFVLHRNEAIYKDSLEFRPERYLNEDQLHSFGHIAFSAGELYLGVLIHMYWYN